MTATFARARPVLEAFGSRIEHVGPVGTGHAMKAVNNALLAVNILAVGEGLAALAKAGVAPHVAVDVLNQSSGRSFVSQSLVPERVLTGLWPRTFRLALLDKDVGIARELLRETGVEAPVLELTGGLLSRARTALGEDADYLEAIRLVEAQAGVEICAADEPLAAAIPRIHFPGHAASDPMSDWGSTNRVPARVDLGGRARHRG